MDFFNRQECAFITKFFSNIFMLVSGITFAQCSSLLPILPFALIQSFAGVWTPAFKISDFTARSLVTALGGKDRTQLVSLHLVSLGTKEMTKSLNLFRYFATDTD